METMDKLPYTREKWEGMGLLDALAEERKDHAVDVLNFSLELLNINSLQYMMPDYSITRESDGMTLTSVDLMRIETILLPLMLRTVAFVNISNEEIVEIYNDVKFEFNKFMRGLDRNDITGIDWEAKFLCEYSDELIKRLQK